MFLFRFLNTFLDRLFAVIGAFIGSQIPSFMQQYTQRLGGHVSELQLLVEEMRKMASYSGKTLEEYIQKFLGSTDTDFVLQGQFMQNIEERWQSLSLALSHLAQSSILTRPYVFLKEMNYEIAKSTLQVFQPTINLTIEGLCYTVAGLLVGYFVYQGIAQGVRLVMTKIRTLFKKPSLNA